MEQIAPKANPKIIHPALIKRSRHSRRKKILASKDRELNISASETHMIQVVSEPFKSTFASEGNIIRCVSKPIRNRDDSWNIYFTLRVMNLSNNVEYKTKMGVWQTQNIGR